MLCPPSGKMVFVIFRRFLNFGPFFGPFLGTLVENSKHKTLIFRSQKCLFQKCTFSGPQLSRRGLVWYLLKFVKSPRFARAWLLEFVGNFSPDCTDQLLWWCRVTESCSHANIALYQYKWTIRYFNWFLGKVFVNWLFSFLLAVVAQSYILWSCQPSQAILTRPPELGCVICQFSRPVTAESDTMEYFSNFLWLLSRPAIWNPV